MSLALQPLGPAGAPQTAADLVARMGLWDDPGHAERPRVVVAMIGSADGRATVEGRAGGLGSPADRSVLRELRCAADALLVGSATLFKEPLMATISRALDPRLPEIALFAEPEQRVVVYSEAGDEAPSRGADVRTHRFEQGGLNARACLRHLRLELGAKVVVSEGGPTLLRELLAEGLVDDLVLTVAPALVAGEGRSVVHGAVFDPPLDLELREVLRSGGHLFLHYVPAATA